VGIGRILTDAFVQILFDFPNFYVVSPIRLDGISRSLGRPFEDTGKDLQFARTVSEKADANAMLSGKLARVGGTYVLNTTLTELPSERLLGTFQAQSDNSEHLLKDLTSEVSEHIRTKLGVSASSAINKSVDQVATGSLEAYAHAVRGQELVWEGDWQAAIPELNKALESDPEMGLAWSGLACAYSWAGGDDARSKAALRKAEELLDRMNRKEQRWVEVIRLWGNGNSALYRKSSEQYIQDFPDDREGYLYLGLGAQYLEKNCHDALTWYEKAYALTPNFYPVTKAIVDCQLKLNNKERAISALERYLEVPLLGEYGRAKAQGLLDKLRKKS
jgi:tetratricopeptide (TPR) repeat protein